MKKNFGLLPYFLFLMACFFAYFIFCVYVWNKPDVETPQIELFSAEELQSIVNAEILDGWVEDNGKSYYYDNGKIVYNQWIDDQYYVGEDGSMLKDTMTPDGYYVDINGKYVSDYLDGWVEEDENYFYYKNGEKVVNQWIDDQYYVGEDGAMLKDTMTPDGYYVDANGKYVQQ